MGSKTGKNKLRGNKVVENSEYRQFFHVVLLQKGAKEQLEEKVVLRFFFKVIEIKHFINLKKDSVDNEKLVTQEGKRIATAMFWNRQDGWD